MVSWLPQYHDMGLIGSYLGVIYCGGSGFYLSPFAFLKNPLVWLQAISEHRGTHMQVGVVVVAREKAACGRQLSCSGFILRLIWRLWRKWFAHVHCALF